MIYDRIITLLWAVVLAFLMSTWLGTTNILSQTLQVTNIAYAADVIFVVTCAIFAGCIWFLMPKPLSVKARLAALLPPALIILYFFF